MPFALSWIFDRLSPRRRESLLSVGLLFLRLTTGGLMLWRHGSSKLLNFGEYVEKFADPIGIGPAASLVLSVTAEFFCAIAVMLGFATRLAAIPLVINMGVAAFIVHSGDPWGRKEFALLYFIPFAFFIFSGAGRYSLDSVLSKRLGQGASSPDLEEA
jgi:putative oxidoreductase